MRPILVLVLVVLVGCSAESPGETCLDEASCAAVEDAATMPDPELDAGLEAGDCFDGIRNGGEGDVDCGGSCAARCSTNQTCQAGDDCASGVCDGTCGLPTCTDGVRNQNETDVDCGGTYCTADCSVDQRCTVKADCAGALACANGVCTAP